MSARVSKAAIESIKSRITDKIKEVSHDLPKDDLNEAREVAIKELGLAPFNKKWIATQEKLKLAQAGVEEVRKEVKDHLGDTYDVSPASTLLSSLTGSSWSKTRFDRVVNETLASIRSKSEPGQQVLRLEKLLKDMDLTLELAGSSAEVKEALKNILAQIGE